MSTPGERKLAQRRHRVKWRSKNVERVRVQDSRYKAAHKAEISVVQKIYRETHVALIHRLSSKRYSENKALEQARNAVYRQENTEQLKDSYLKRRFGITLAEYMAMESSQGGLCAICKLPEPSGKKMAVDHCHKTGLVRGLLCHLCNRSLGGFRDDPKIMEAALLYLLGKKCDL